MPTPAAPRLPGPPRGFWKMRHQVHSPLQKFKRALAPPADSIVATKAPSIPATKRPPYRRFSPFALGIRKDEDGARTHRDSRQAGGGLRRRGHAPPRVRAAPEP